ncbi:MAG: hypothetical protein SGCHY_003301 [Lobulomycetales sp.]
MNAHLLLRLDIRLKLAMVKNALKDIAHGSEFLILQWMMGDATPLEFFNNRGNLPLSMISDRPEKWKEIAAAYYREQTAKLGLHELDPSPNRDQQVQPNRKRPAVNGDKRNPKRPAVNSDQRNPKRPVVSSDQRNPKRPAVSSDKRNPKRPAVSSDQQNPKRPVMNSDQRNPKRPAVSSDQRNPKRPVLRSTAQRVPDLPALSFYGAYHNNNVNRYIHMVFVPCLMLTVLIWLSKFGSICIFVSIMYILYYLTLETTAALLYVPVIAALNMIAFSLRDSVENVDSLALYLHLASWIFQFIGSFAASSLIV